MSIIIAHSKLDPLMNRFESRKIKSESRRSEELVGANQTDYLIHFDNVYQFDNNKIKHLIGGKPLQQSRWKQQSQETWSGGKGVFTL